MRSKRRYEIWTGVKGDDKHGGIYLYKYEADENKLLLVRQEVQLRGFTHIAMSSDKNTLLVTGKTDADQDVLQSYRIADQNGSLIFMNETVLHTAGDVCHLSISPDEKIIAVRMVQFIFMKWIKKERSVLLYRDWNLKGAASVTGRIVHIHIRLFLQQTVSIVMWQILDLIRCGY